MGDQFALKNNQIFVLAEAAGGVYNSDQLRMLCEVADNESAFLKITEDQRIGFMVDPSKLAEVQTQVRKSGLLLRSYKSSGVPSPRACLGELCTFAHQPSLGDALELTTHLLKSFPAPKRFSTIGVNGCQRACLGSSTEDVHIVAEESGYKISIGGKSSDIPQQAQLILENVPRADLPAVIERLLAVFYQESQENERIFDVIERTGLTPFLNALPEHLVPAVSDADLSSPLPEGMSSDEAAGPIGIEGDTSAGLSATDAIDDLIDSSSQEFANSGNLADSIGNLDMSEISSADPSASTAADMTTEDAMLIAAEAGDTDEFSDGLAGELLEVADSELEEGSLEDVERVRDAIRTELSMSPSSDQGLRPQVGGLLDELPPDGDDSTEGFGDLDTLTQDPLGENIGPLSSADDLNADSDLLADTADISDFAQDAAAGLEYGKPAAKPAQRAAAAPTAPAHNQSRPKAATPAPAIPKPVGGRLSIRFEGTQLAVELPSGLSFDLPFESVADGGELAMSLPDGDLRIQREGQLLAVNFGLLNLKIPIPDFDARQVA